MSTSELAELLDRVEHVMFDFDGPICSVFAGRPVSGVAQRLRELVQASTELPSELVTATDPLLFWHAAPMWSPELAERVRRELGAEELAAVESAEPTSGGHDAIARCRRAGKVVTVVSNNAVEAINVYLSQHGLAESISFVSARESPDPTLMKSNPHLVLSAMEATKQRPEHSVLI